MGTRLRYEKMIRDKFPEIRWLRVYSSGYFEVVVYACDENLNLSNSLAQQLSIFLENQGAAHIKHIVKHYFFIREDNVPPASEPPPEIKHIALYGELDARGIKESIIKAFPFLNMKMVTVENDVVRFSVSDNIFLTDIEKMFIRDYLHEIVPLGMRIELP
ncbi:hypothetical protein L9W92_02255 [Pelotomaculum terephthalicicum JT]|uniref:hypothetical protein n=1 Tax=Pelotomaculum TaxID=191373 RepID=UPI0009C8766B|nr:MULTISPECIES: hypothetical protein [Pelotomaculum]MCG9966881.1 hypothetical protein [Pelotomaculum terephthalicicum JT]OPX87974.1 MAG: hypothetical protein A4E54_01416 [Pelotomaculum sp. PtaB.Bin117]OPY59001.1 MAG: hypothetical protein A4E56_03311 [Pelotomaculum sp. PtaU1.Bin065]